MDELLKLCYFPGGTYGLGGSGSTARHLVSDQQRALTYPMRWREDGEEKDDALRMKLIDLYSLARGGSINPGERRPDKAD